MRNMFVCSLRQELGPECWPLYSYCCLSLEGSFLILRIFSMPKKSLRVEQIVNVSAAKKASAITMLPNFVQVKFLVSDKRNLAMYFAPFIVEISVNESIIKLPYQK